MTNQKKSDIIWHVLMKKGDFIMKLSNLNLDSVRRVFQSQDTNADGVGENNVRRLSVSRVFNRKRVFQSAILLGIGVTQAFVLLSGCSKGKDDAPSTVIVEEVPADEEMDETEQDVLPEKEEEEQVDLLGQFGSIDGWMTDNQKTEAQIFGNSGTTTTSKNTSNKGETSKNQSTSSSTGTGTATETVQVENGYLAPDGYIYENEAEYLEYIAGQNANNQNTNTQNTTGMGSGDVSLEGPNPNTPNMTPVGPGGSTGPLSPTGGPGSAPSYGPGMGTNYGPGMENNYGSGVGTVVGVDRGWVGPDGNVWDSEAEYLEFIYGRNHNYDYDYDYDYDYGNDDVITGSDIDGDYDYENDGVITGSEIGGTVDETVDDTVDGTFDITEGYIDTDQGRKYYAEGGCWDSKEEYEAYKNSQKNAEEENNDDVITDGGIVDEDIVDDGIVGEEVVGEYVDEVTYGDVIEVEPMLLRSEPLPASEEEVVNEIVGEEVTGEEVKTTTDEVVPMSATSEEQLLEVATIENVVTDSSEDTEEELKVDESAPLPIEWEEEIIHVEPILLHSDPLPADEEVVDEIVGEEITGEEVENSIVEQAIEEVITEVATELYESGETIGVEEISAEEVAVEEEESVKVLSL